MPRYRFSAENGTAITAADAIEDLVNDQAAIEHARRIAQDLASSIIARSKSRIVVRNEAGDEIGNVPLLPTRR